MAEERSAKAVFGAALDLPLEQRPGFLDDACAGDPGLRERVMALLDAHRRAEGFLGAPTQGLGGRGDEFAAPEPGTAQDEAAREGVGAAIGPYRLVRLIGEGGFGVVFLAEQDAPIRRRVALKIIKPGMDTRQVSARFEAERRTLALMDHPGIARVLDAGATAGGRPYFVMELVEGEPVTAFCTRTGLPLRRRLELYREVCHAVQHAHTKGIIHRDLKPTNVLVTVVDGIAVPKVIDFGIAKAAAGAPSEAGPGLTEARQLVGTPEYMSPEQAGAGGVRGSDIDTRADIYSLGVLLYELLTGAPPFDPERLRSAEWEEMRRIIREEEPPRPSMRLRSAAGGPSAASAGAAQPPTAAGAIRGDLDWIVMKCLEKDRSRRYETASALALDIGRHLGGEPVLAAPPSRLYRVRKLLHRRRREALAAGLVLASLLGAVAGTTSFAVRASRQRALAEERADQIGEIAAFQERMLSGFDLAQLGRWMREDVLAEAERTWRWSGAQGEEVARRKAELERLLEGANFTNPAISMLDRAIFERALGALETAFAGQPLVRATLLQNVAGTLTRLNMADRAGTPQAAALSIREAALSPDHPDVIESQRSTAYMLGGRGQWRDALPLAERALAASIRSAAGEGGMPTLECRALLGTVYFRLSRYGPCEEQRRLVFDGFARALGRDDRRTVNAELHLGQALMWLRRYDEAEACFQRALDVSPEDDPNAACGLTYLAMLRWRQGNSSEAEDLLRRAIAVSRPAAGDGDSDVAFRIAQLGWLHLERGEWSRFEARAREALEVRRRFLGDAHPLTIYSHDNVGTALLHQGRFDEAELHLRRALEGPGVVPGQTTADDADPFMHMGMLHLRRDRPAEAEPLLREAVSRYAAGFGSAHMNTRRAERELGKALLSMGRINEADEHLVRAGAGLGEAPLFGAGLALLRGAQGRRDEAESLFREALEALRRLRAQGHPDIVEVSIDYAGFLNVQHRFSDALDVLTPVVPLSGAAATEAQVRWLGDLLLALGTARLGLGDYAGAEPALTDARAALARLYGENHGRTARCTAQLIRLYVAWHAAEPGGGHDARAAAWRAMADHGSETQ